ncbi:Zn-dependent alcohol dehydrogenases, class III [Zymobacter palmae]|uniref:Zn-dependent alcohol dehydrogenases, class III n=1 Tax=Zymobacter palmae TaxID=33074 RepID=A0A348HI39_9GAMM|nr:Zn-dependent alcohol dehydrogenases, class III [Zymobacter palmae]
MVCRNEAELSVLIHGGRQCQLDDGHEFAGRVEVVLLIHLGVIQAFAVGEVEERLDRQLARNVGGPCGQTEFVLGAEAFTAQLLLRLQSQIEVVACLCVGDAFIQIEAAFVTTARVGDAGVVGVPRVGCGDAVLVAGSAGIRVRAVLGTAAIAAQRRIGIDREVALGGDLDSALWCLLLRVQDQTAVVAEGQLAELGVLAQIREGGCAGGDRERARVPGVVLVGIATEHAQHDTGAHIGRRITVTCGGRVVVALGELVGRAGFLGSGRGGIREGMLCRHQCEYCPKRAKNIIFVIAHGSYHYLYYYCGVIFIKIIIIIPCLNIRRPLSVVVV